MDDFGPFHRLASPTQDLAVARAMEENGELWGRAPRGAATPQVQAYVGPLPENRIGVEFMTSVRPTPGTPPFEARWRPGSEGVRVDGEFARIAIRVTRNTQWSRDDPPDPD